jgi:hypothetical protein
MDAGHYQSFNHTLEFALQLKKITEHLTHVSQKLLYAICSVEVAVFLRAASTGLLISSYFQLRLSNFGQPLVNTRVFQVVELWSSPHWLSVKALVPLSGRRKNGSSKSS